MALTTVQSNNKLIKFRKEITREYVRENLFSPYMGTGMNSIIRIMNDLKSGGEQVNVPLVNALAATAVGSGTLAGNEESIDNYGFRMWIDWARNAVKTNKAETQRDSTDIFDQARPLLSDWGKSLIRDEIIDAFNSLPSESAPANLGTAAGQRVNGISMDNATAAQRNTWVSDNSDRVLFGALVSNYSATFATATATLDTTADKLTAANLTLAKRLALAASPKIRPYKTKNGYEYYVAFAGLEAFRDLSQDSTIQNANLYARAREGGGMNSNPLFQDGDLIYDGVIVRQVPEMSTRNPTFYATAGNGGTTHVQPVFICGQSAMAQFYGQMPRPTRLDNTDYEFNRGVGIEMAYGVGKIAKKTSSKLKDWGVFTMFVAAAGDA
jgi:hypothetical protein